MTPSAAARQFSSAANDSGVAPTPGHTGPRQSVLTGEEQDAIERANATQRRAVVLLHGLWLLPNSWDRWAERFAQGGYTPLMPGWPEEGHRDPAASDDSQLIGGIRVEAVAQHYAHIIMALYRKPVIIGHSFGGLIAQMLAGRGLAKVTVAIEPAPFRGVLPLPAPALRPLLTHPSNRHRAVPLSYAQFCRMFANTLQDDEARTLYEQFVVPAPGRPLFEAAAANINLRTEIRVDTAAAARGPLLIIAGEKDEMFPCSIARACYERQRRNQQITEIVQIPDRGHSITIDHGWRLIANTVF